jgi:hypothetical protein
LVPNMASNFHAHLVNEAVFVGNSRNFHIKHLVHKRVKWNSELIANIK